MTRANVVVGMFSSIQSFVRNWKLKRAEEKKKIQKRAEYAANISSQKEITLDASYYVIWNTDDFKSEVVSNAVTTIAKHFASLKRSDLNTEDDFKFIARRLPYSSYNITASELKLGLSKKYTSLLLQDESVQLQELNFAIRIFNLWKDLQYSGSEFNELISVLQPLASALHAKRLEEHVQAQKVAERTI